MKKLNKIFIVYPLILMIILSAMFAATVDYSYAAESFKVSHGTKWVQGLNIDSGLRVETTGGKIAYCLNQGKADASGSYSNSLSLSSKMKAVLYHGYPNNKKFGTTSLSADQARCATQLAVWSHDSSGKGNKINLSKLHGAYDKKPKGDKVLKAAKWLHNKADSGYNKPEKPELFNPKLTKPKDNTPHFFSSNYVRIGPYKYKTTDNKYTSNQTVKVDLSGAPKGTQIGDASAGFYKKPINNQYFYVYIPSKGLEKLEKGSFKITASYEYKYEKASTFEAYEKSSTQNVAISTKKEFEDGKKELATTAEFRWNNPRIQKVDEDNRNKPIKDTEFKIYFDPTPENTRNNDWVFMYHLTTDSSGVIKIPGVGNGRYKAVEVKPNSDYSLNSEHGGSDEIVFNITDVSKDTVQIMTNKLMDVSCEVDKDTIKKTSAAYRSLPDQEGIDNVNKETFRYHVDYRSTSGVWADEFVLDDPLKGVSRDQIRVTELWTPISHGDYDKKMNVWYKTNKTDDSVDYSEERAVKNNPTNPNNPDKKSLKKNTGFKLWEKDVPTTKRANLKVENLGLEDDEYITAIRLEHGRVEKGFTTKNYETNSLNNDQKVDWRPNSSDRFFTKGSSDATGLKPLTYLVKCPNPLSPPEVISDSASSYISRNLKLEDDDEDNVVTEVIDTFKETPVDDNEPPQPEGEKPPKEVFENPPLSKGENDKPVPMEGKTADKFSLIGCIVLIISAAVALILLRKKSRTKILPVILIGILLTGMFTPDGQTYASSSSKKSASSNFTQNNVEYSLVSKTPIKTSSNETAYKVEYEVDEKMKANEFESTDIKKILPEKTAVAVSSFKGNITIDKKEITPIYTKRQRQIDKKEVFKNLDIEDVANLPKSKVYEIRSDESPHSTVEKDLKRAGVALSVKGYDEDGVPNLWDATLIFRGLEKYLEPKEYKVNALYKGKVRAENSGDDKDSGGTLARTVSASSDDASKEWLDENSSKVAKKKYYKSLGYDIPDGATEEEMDAIVSEDEGSGMKTADVMKFIALLAGGALISFLGFVFLQNRKKKSKLRK